MLVMLSDFFVVIIKMNKNVRKWSHRALQRNVLFPDLPQLRFNGIKMEHYFKAWIFVVLQHPITAFISYCGSSRSGCQQDPPIGGL